MDKILQLIDSKCSVCQQQCTVTARIVGCALEVKWKCSNGHKFNWASSPTIRNANRRVIYNCNLDFAKAVLLSGKNYYKIHHFCKILDMQSISLTTYFAFQQLFLCSVISDFYYRTMVSCTMYVCHHAIISLYFLRTTLYKDTHS